MEATIAGTADRPVAGGETRKIIWASSLGTAFEWYDFILFGALAPVIAKQFFTKVDPTTGLVFALLAFSAGFIVRPFGALVFGRLGDVVGRKYTFLMTILIMGLSTFAVGLLPNYDSIGIAAPILLIVLRLLQGLAVGGEYGGAVVYVAEHAPKHRRGEFTSWIQTTGTIGFMLSLIVVLATRTATGEAAFAEWGWRIPFLLSIILLGLSVWVRMAMHESPVFARMKASGTLSKAPLSEAFGRWGNVKIVLTALFGLIAGFGVVWYATQFYVLLFLTQTLKVDGPTANLFVIVTLILATPFFVVFGALSDRIGRKWLVLGGIFLAAVSFFPVFKGLTHFANPALEKALATAPVTVKADPADCQFQLNVTGTKKFTSSCDVIKARLVAAGVNYANEAAPAGSVAEVRIGDKVLASFDARTMTKEAADARNAALSKDLAAALKQAGYPAKADPEQINRPMVLLLMFLLVFFLAMSYGPVAAMLVEMFPTRIRYSSLSLPYHIGTGWVGGLMPTVAFAMVAYQGDIYYGLWFPVVIALGTVLVGILCVRETKDVNINA
ncbi:MAG TPA: MFS transporter [Nonomuraea sp.]|nr:MFS transporter [Nonomuraea sp.]